MFGRGVINMNNESILKIGFDNDKYLRMQSDRIRERIGQFGKLYLELGGKLFDDYHASRVLPGFAPDSKIRMFSQLKDELEIVIVINASDIEKSKKRGDLGITYDDDVMRLIDAFRALGFLVGSVCITRYRGQAGADNFIRRLNKAGIRSYLHYPIDGYPTDVQKIVSEDGYSKNDYIETTRPLVLVTAPGPGSGKMATCLSQLYHENKRGVKAGYAKFETFPIWNLPLKHPVNIAYEAATADLDDVNMIDPFHLEAHGTLAVNYNRDVEIFPVLKAMMEKIMGSSPYASPTDMGVNMAGFCIFDDEAVCAASKMEVWRRYYKALVDIRKGEADDAQKARLELLMQQLGIDAYYCPAVKASLDKAAQTDDCAAAMVLPDGKVVTGKNSTLLGPSAALLLNAVKTLAGIPKEVKLVSPQALEPICHLKTEHLRNHNPRLHSDEILIALSISSITNPVAEMAMQQLDKLKGCDAHFTTILSPVDVNTYKKLGINVTCEPKYQVKKLYHGIKL